MQTRRLISLLILASGGAFDATAAKVTVLHEFAWNGADGMEPHGAMLRASDGALYGTALRGGDQGQGVIFKLSPETKDYQVLHHFSWEKSNGRSPASSLVEGKDGVLYGTTSLGGSTGLGTVFKINKDGKAFTILFNFSDVGKIGRVPYGGLRQGKDGAWLGTTEGGGQDEGGTVFRLNPDGTGHRVLRHFGRKFRQDGEGPRGALCQGTDGRWYGITTAGGRDDGGTIFGLKGDGSGYRLLRAFIGGPQDAARPMGDLIEARDGKLYGTSVSGGSSAQGTVFRLNKDGTAFEIMRAFPAGGDDGRNPYAGLLEGKDGMLYGVALNGGAQGGGVVFQIIPVRSSYRTLFAFSAAGAEGRGPYAALNQGPDGSLYGSTVGGSPGRAGTIFRIRLTR